MIKAEREAHLREFKFSSWSRFHTAKFGCYLKPQPLWVKSSKICLQYIIPYPKVKLMRNLLPTFICVEVHKSLQRHVFFYSKDHSKMASSKNPPSPQPIYHKILYICVNYEHFECERIEIVK